MRGPSQQPGGPWIIRKVRGPAERFLDSLNSDTRDWVYSVLKTAPKPYPNDPLAKRKGHMKGRRHCIYHLREVDGDKAVFYALDEKARAVDIVHAGSHDSFDRKL
jgi:hypothetical protein